jgi:hypothetical protein
MPEVRLPVDVVRGVPVVTAPGEIDVTNATALRTALLEAAALGRGALVADMSSTPNFSSLKDALAARLPQPNCQRPPRQRGSKLDRAKSHRLAEARSERRSAI